MAFKPCLLPQDPESSRTSTGPGGTAQMPPAVATVAQRPSPGLWSAPFQASLGESSVTQKPRCPAVAQSTFAGQANVLSGQATLSWPCPCPRRLREGEVCGDSERVCSCETGGSFGPPGRQPQHERPGPQTPGWQRSVGLQDRSLPSSGAPAAGVLRCSREVRQGHGCLSKPPAAETPRRSSARPSAAGRTGRTGRTGRKLRPLPPLRSPSALCFF